MGSTPLARRLNPVRLHSRKSPVREKTRLQDVHRVVSDLQKSGQAVYFYDEGGRKRRIPNGNKLFTDHAPIRQWGLPNEADDYEPAFQRDEVDLKPQDLDDAYGRSHVSMVDETMTARPTIACRMKRPSKVEQSVRPSANGPVEDDARSDHARSPADDDDDDERDLSNDTPPLDFEIGNTVVLDRVYRWIFSHIQELSLKYILKDWVKELEPKKSRNYPYCGGERTAPPWWPLGLGVEHREPDHLKKTPRHKLARVLITYAMDPKFERHGIDRLKHSTSNTKLAFDTDGKQKDVRALRRRELLEQLYDLMEQEFMLKNDEIDAGSQVSLRNATLRQAKHAQAGKRSRRGKAKYTTRHEVYDMSQDADSVVREPIRDTPLNFHQLAPVDSQVAVVPPRQIKRESQDVTLDPTPAKGQARQGRARKHSLPKQRLQRQQSGEISQHPTWSLPPRFSCFPPLGSVGNVDNNQQQIAAFHMSYSNPQGFPTSTMPMSCSFDSNVDVMMTTPALSGTSSTASPREHHHHLLQASYDASFTPPSSFYLPPSAHFDDAIDVHADAQPINHFQHLRQPAYVQPAYQQMHHQSTTIPPPSQHFSDTMPWAFAEAAGLDVDQKFPFSNTNFFV